MKLRNAAKYFDDMDMVDPYTGLLLPFKAQFSTFDDTNPDGSISKRRSMSLAPGITLPARRAVQIMGENWIIGEGNQDGIFNRPIRQTVPMKRVTDLFTLLTPAQAILAETGAKAYGRKEFLKDTVNGVTDSEYYPFYELFLPTTETVSDRTFVRDGAGRLYRARSKYGTNDGFTCLEADQLTMSAITFAEAGSQVYDPVTDTYAAGTTNMQCLIMQPHQLYSKKTESDHAYVAGDLTVLVRMIDMTPVPGQTLSLDLDEIEWVDAAWWNGLTPGLILNATPEANAWNIHLRRA